MFGYIRPFKPELLMRQWEYYRSAYCGLCKEIGRSYGQLPRLALTYDMTFLTILLSSLAADASHPQKGICLLNPAKGKLIMPTNSALEFSAAATIMLAHYKGEDDRQDGKKLRGGVVIAAFASARRKVLKKYPELDAVVGKKLEELAEAENQVPDSSDPAMGAATIFGSLLSEIFREGVTDTGAADRFTDEHDRQALIDTVGYLGYDIGRWIYIIDAIDDLQADMDNDEWNPFAGHDINTARKMADQILSDIEISLDKTAILIPFVRNSALIANLIRLGLPHVRARILSGAGLEKM